MTSYGSLKSSLIARFQADRALTSRIAAATTLDEIVAALAASYRAWLLAAAEAARGTSLAQAVSVAAAETAADAREAAVLEVMAFFERDRAATAEVEVRRTGARQLRVVCRQRPQPNGQAVAS